jgi:nucleotide-binding universal stress UspA family protein
MSRIVVAVDGSSAANAAARWAAREAAMRNVDLTVVHVAHAALGAWPQRGWPAIPLPPEFGEDEIAQGKRVLDDTLEVIAKTTGPHQPKHISTRLCFGSVVPTLCQFTRHPAQMIVVGRRGRGGIHRALLGSVSSSVVHTARCPLAVVHNDTSCVQSSRAPVVVGIDHSPAAEWATAIAFDEASKRAVDLLAVHAIDHADASQAEELLAQRLAGFQQSYPDVGVRCLVTRAHPADALLGQAQHAQLVVVGSRGRGSLTGKLLGSVSAAVVQGCRIPVIVARREALNSSCKPTDSGVVSIQSCIKEGDLNGHARR